MLGVRVENAKYCVESLILLGENMKLNLMWLLHNTIGHPIAGFFWFIGLIKVGNLIHDKTLPEETS